MQILTTEPHLVHHCLHTKRIYKHEMNSPHSLDWFRDSKLCELFDLKKQRERENINGGDELCKSRLAGWV